MKLRAPSPALVISFIALVVALSATAYAATRVNKSSQIKNGIITSSDIKNSTIKSSDIKNRTILSSDLSRSTLTRIDKGGVSPANSAMEGIRKAGPVSQPANQLIKVATLTIPAGSYVISAKTTLSAILQPGIFAATASCKLDAGGDEDQADALIAAETRSIPSTLYMQTTRTVGGSTAVAVTCAASSAFNATNTSIIAQRVTSTDKKEVGGS